MLAMNYIMAYYAFRSIILKIKTVLMSTGKSMNCGDLTRSRVESFLQEYDLEINSSLLSGESAQSKKASCYVDSYRTRQSQREHEPSRRCMMVPKPMVFGFNFA